MEKQLKAQASHESITAKQVLKLLLFHWLVTYYWIIMSLINRLPAGQSYTSPNHYHLFT